MAVTIRILKTCSLWLSLNSYMLFRLWKCQKARQTQGYWTRSSWRSSMPKTDWNFSIDRVIAFEKRHWNGTKWFLLVGYCSWTRMFLYKSFPLQMSCWLKHNLFFSNTYQLHLDAALRKLDSGSMPFVHTLGFLMYSFVKTT